MQIIVNPQTGHIAQSADVPALDQRICPKCGSIYLSSRGSNAAHSFCVYCGPEFRLYSSDVPLFLRRQRARVVS